MSNFHIISDFLRSIACEKARGHQFEKFSKWFLENDSYYKQKFKTVWLWKNWPEKWGRDKGIDLIAETFDGEFWAIQAKAYDENHYITKDEINSFLSESNRSIIAHRLLIATTDKIGPNADEVIKGQEKGITCYLRSRLEDIDVDWSLALENKQSAIQKPKEPRLHQEDALTAILKGFETSSQGQVHMACGTGKSLVGLWLAQRLKSEYTLVLVPSLSLVSQLYKTWVANSGDFKFNPIFVCSDQTVADEEDMSTKEFGYPVTTSAEELIKFFKKDNNLPIVVFATYHSSLVLKEACLLNTKLVFDLVIADEAHRCTGKKDSDFVVVTHKDSITAKRKLYMTATPKIYSENVKNKTQEHGIEIASMDDEDKFGPVFYKLLFSQAIDKKLLSDYHVFISVINNAIYKEYAEKGRFVRFDTIETDARTLATQIYTAKAIKNLALNKIITFHNSVKAAKDFIKSFQNAVILLPYDEKPFIQYYDVITNEKSQAERNKILKKFASTEMQGASILGNVKCLSEGVDVPVLDGIVFVDPKGSDIDIIQSVGRVIRPSDNKHIGTILIPIFVDINSDHEIDLENSCFKKVWHIVRALRSHDDMLAEELDNIRLELGKRTYKTPAKLNKITIDIPVEIEKSFAESLNFKLIEKCSQLSLAQSHPDIAVQWHSTKNGNLTPNNVTTGSNQKIWWKCPVADDHEWDAMVANRTLKKQNCPCCSNQKVVLSNCLVMTHPNIAAEWHPTKNGVLTPYEVVAGSKEKVWWKCLVAEDHEWEADLSTRTMRNYGCPCCSNQKIVLSNCLATTHPEIAGQWHPIKNGELTPYDVGAGSKQEAWWKCDIADDHEWKTSISNRIINTTKCPCCVGKKVSITNCLMTIYPDIAAQWHPTKNGETTPYDIIAGSNKKAWWKCSVADDHEWQAQVNNRKNNGCPCCAGKKVSTTNCLAIIYPDIATQWHSIKNGDLTPYNVIAGSKEKIWWKCPVAEDHEWIARVSDRKRFGCPCCAGRKVVPSNCLATTYPEIAVEWHPTKNGNLTPFEVTAGSNKMVWWKCSIRDDHEWQAKVNDRKRYGCLKCWLKK